MLPNEDKEKLIREKQYIRKRITICAVITAVIFCGFLARLFVWQIIEGKDYDKIAVNSTAYTVTTDATRGEILDRNGVGLAVNSTGYRIALDKLYIDENKLNDTVLKLIALVESGGEKWIDNLPIRLNSKNEFVFTKHSALDGAFLGPTSPRFKSSLQQSMII